MDYRSSVIFFLFAIEEIEQQFAPRVLEWTWIGEHALHYQELIPKQLREKIRLISQILPLGI